MTRPQHDCLPAGLLCIEAVTFPTNGVCINIVPDLLVAYPISDNMVMERSLPQPRSRNIFGYCRFVLSNDCRQVCCTTFLNHYNRMHMIGHYHILIHFHPWKMIGYLFHAFLCGFPVTIQNTPTIKIAFLFMGAYGHKVVILFTIIVPWNSGGFAKGYFA